MNVKYLIPSALTLSNLTCGVLAILIGDNYFSSLLILLAAIFDLFDGAAARALNATSAIGKELDSLCDLVSFGVAPAYLYFLLAPGKGDFFYIAPVVLVLCGAWRLAKFNTLPPSKDFKGLAIPGAAIFIVGMVLGFHWDQTLLMGALFLPITYLLIAFVTGYLMISNLTLFSFKGLKDASDRPWLIALVVLTVLIAVLDYRLALPMSIVIYVFLGLIKSLTQSNLPKN